MLEGYITPLLMSYIDKYIKNIKPSDLQLSFWGGDAVLRNLELREDVLEREFNFPVEFKSGRIRELTLHIPWSAITSKPVEATIKDLEFVIKLRSPHSTSSSNTETAPQPAARSTEEAKPVEGQIGGSDGEQAPGYLQGYTSRISNNVLFHIQNMVVKVIEEDCDMMFTLNFGSVKFYTANDNWEKGFVYTDYFQGNFSLCKVLEVTDVAMNLHSIESSNQAEVTKEPFVQRCSFTCRIKSEFRGSLFVKKSIHLLFDSIHFFLDEKQFCLYLHFLDWLLAIYYSSKRLKGRDDCLQQSPPSSVADQSTTKPDSPSMSPTPPKTELEAAAVSTTAPQGESPAATTNTDSSQQGWGSYMWSYIGGTEEGVAAASATNEQETTPVKTAMEASSSFAIFAKAVSVTFKVTHVVQGPVFYSVRSFTRPVLEINLTGCLFQLDKEPLTRQFLVSTGAVSVHAAIANLCPCTKKFPTSWRSSAMATDTTGQVSVFSLGAPTADAEQVLSGSLFAPSPPPSTPHTLTPPSPPCSCLEAVCLTYEYYDTGPSRAIEECTETLSLGRARVTVCPDLLHRLMHFQDAFTQSLHANPLSSQGMVVIGDGQAETVVKLSLAGLEATLTHNAHYLATTQASSSTHRKPKPPPLPQNAHSPLKKSRGPKLSCLCLSVEASRVSVTQPMYSGNTTEEVAQKWHIRAQFGAIEGSIFKARTLEDCFTVATSKDAGRLEKFLHLPGVEFSQHSETHGDDSKKTSYLQLDLDEISSTISLMQIRAFFYLISSWRLNEALPNLDHVQPPTAAPDLKSGSTSSHLHLCLQHLTLTQSSSEQHTLLSVVLGEARLAVVRESEFRRLCCMVPVLCGPLNTAQWNAPQFYQDCSQMTPRPPPSKSAERLVEFFIATPHQNCKEAMFPTVQLSVAGFAVSLEPLLLSFLHELPTDAMAAAAAPPAAVQPSQTASALGRQDSLRRPPTAAAAAATPPHSEDGREEEEEGGRDSNNHDLLATLKLYAAKVKLHSVLVVFPSDSYTLAAPDSLVQLLPDFPLLTLLATPPSSRQLPTVQLSPPFTPSTPFTTPSKAPSSTPPLTTLTASLLSLPTLTLESAKSHVLDEPVPKSGRQDTLPWNCTLSQLAVFTIIDGRCRSVLDPLTLRVALVPQQESSGLDLHTDTVALSLSHKQAELLHDTVSQLSGVVSAFYAPSVIQRNQSQDSGIVSLTETPPHPPPHTPSTSSPAPSTLHTLTESTASSSVMYAGFTSLWVQVLVSKLVVNLYGRVKTPETSDQDSTCGYDTPLTSPGVPLPPKTTPPCGGDKLPAEEKALRVSLEVDGVSFQLDVQEKYMDAVFKVASMECALAKKDSASLEEWISYFPGGNRKLFSSSGSTLPESLSPLTPPSMPPLSEVTIPSSSSTTAAAAAALGGGGTLISPQAHQRRSFILVKAKLPRSEYQAVKNAKVYLNLHEFELVAWLPVLDFVRGIVSAFASRGSEAVEVKPSHAIDVSAWPSLEVSLESFRVVLPTADFSDVLLLSTGGAHVTSALDWASSDMRFIVNSGAFRRLCLLSSERRLPPLPAYQLSAYSITLWGITKTTTPPGSVKPLLLTSSVDVRVVYTPPLTAPPSPLLPSRDSGGGGGGALACGHCCEATLATDLHLFVGTEQAGCVSAVVAANSSSPSPPLTEPAPPPPSDVPPPPHTPYKASLTGRTIAISLLHGSDDGHSDLHGDVQSDGVVTPLLQASLYNPVLSVHSLTDGGGGGREGELSCFSAAISYSTDQEPMTYSELMNSRTVSGVLSHQLLEARGGVALDDSGLPPSLLTLHWSEATPTTSSSSAGAVSVAVAKPVKVSITPHLVESMLTLWCDLSSLLPALRRGEAVPPTTAAAVAATPSIKLSTVQLLVEAQLSEQSTAEEGRQDVSSMEAEASSVLQGETTPPPPPPCKEGVLVSWHQLSLFYPPPRSAQVGGIHVQGLGVFCIVDGRMVAVVPPTQLDCSLKRHLPCSELDLPLLSVEVCCGLLQLNLSERAADVVRRTATSFSGAAVGAGSQHEEGEEGEGEGRCRVEHFTDDLRSGDFTYVEVSEPDAVDPLPGQIVFNSGDVETPPTMTWEYREWRTVTSLSMIPVPFGITSEEDVPVNIQVECSLESWDTSSAKFVSHERFLVSESQAVELPSLSCPSARRWRVSVCHVQWLEEGEEEGEVCTAAIFGPSSFSSPVPLSSVLSPLALAASLRINSTFSSAVVPVLRVALTCTEFEATLFHHPSSRAAQGVCFRGYHLSVLDSPQELLRLRVGRVRGELQRCQLGLLTAQLSGAVSLDFVDLGDMTWRTALYPVDTSLSVDHAPSLPVPPSPPPSLSVTLESGAGVLRVSQGLLHTSALAATVWGGGAVGVASPPILNHFIICNNSLEDIHFGQATTEEDVLLPSGGCVGYSWCRHTPPHPHQLHMCVVTGGGVWRWSQPFPLSPPGVQLVELPLRDSAAPLHVFVTDIGGLQKMVTLSGGWRLASSLPLPLDLRLTSGDGQSGPAHRLLSLPAGGSLPSIVAADQHLGGIEVKTTDCTGVWSKSYPFGPSNPQWRKSPLLAEVPLAGGDVFHCWYTVKPDAVCGHNVGKKVTFSPLFAVCNLLPFDLSLVVAETQAPDSLTLSPLPLPGRGAGPVSLCPPLKADAWYQLRVTASDGLPSSEPPVALSSFLLDQLPTSDAPSSAMAADWPYYHHSSSSSSSVEAADGGSSSSTASVCISLPLEEGELGGRGCSVRASLSRCSLTNTITLWLEAEAMLLNTTPSALTLSTPGREEEVAPGNTALITHNEFTLRAPWGSGCLSSLPLCLPQPRSDAHSKNTDQKQRNVILFGDNANVHAELLLTFEWVGLTMLAAIKPAFVLVNSTESQLSVLPSAASTMEELGGGGGVVLHIKPEEVVPLLFWNAPRSTKYTPSRVLSIKASEKERIPWSIPLSTDFVRRSFSLAVDDGSHTTFTPALLTMHECDSNGATYLVVRHDPAPRLLVQNLCSTGLEVAEAGSTRLHCAPQLVPAGQTAVYEPPSQAKLYPQVFDASIASEEEKRLHEAAQSACVRFRVFSTGDSQAGWSEPYPLHGDQDHIMKVPLLGRILVSAHQQRGSTLTVTLLPTGEAPALQNSSSNFESPLLAARTQTNFSFQLQRLVVCLDDEVSDSWRVSEVLRTVVEGLDARYSSSSSSTSQAGGTTGELKLQSLCIDNMTESSSEEFAVTLLPRCSHAARPQLVHTETPPMMAVSYTAHSLNCIDELCVSVQPFTLQLEDHLMHTLRALLISFTLPGVLRESEGAGRKSLSVAELPEKVRTESVRDSSPLRVSRLVVESTSVYLNARITLKAFLSCNDSPFRFSRFELCDVTSNWSEVSQVITARYVSAVFMHVGWLLGSLELIGSPGTFLQSVGRGLRDLVSLPYEGLTRSPGLFILGIGHGTASFLRELSSGALNSVTGLASSVSRNMERLSMDPDHASYQEKKRRDSPATHFTGGLASGVSSFGLSLMSAVAGIVEQPMQSFQQLEGSPSTLGATRSILAGVGKGLIGVVTKPVGGAMELVSQTGQGIIHGTGLARRIERRDVGDLEVFCGTLKREELLTTVSRCAMKLSGSVVIAAAPASRAVCREGGREGELLLLLVTSDSLHVWEPSSDTLQLSCAVPGCSLSEVGRTEGGQVELEIAMRSADTPVSTAERRESEFQQVEYYLQLSQSENHNEEEIGDRESERGDDGGDSSDRHGVVVLTKPHHACQILSVFSSLSNQANNPASVFCVYTTTTQEESNPESFMSASSRFQ